MFANLVDNAIKYTPSGGKVDVTLAYHGKVRTQESDEGQAHCITVADTGPGIAVGDRKNVFRRFYRVESSRSEHPGHGLGLSLVQAIAHYHRGSVDLLNNNPGLRVMVKLPQ